MDKDVCPVRGTVNIIGKKWSLMTIYNLSDGSKGFNELLRSANGISSKTLSTTLSKLREEGIVDRRVQSDSPIRVEYSLTEKGKDLQELVDCMKQWGKKWL
ncbi:MAG: winged helix-turn-helix transcriptional regulator [Candidatus Hydrothermarchaeaceae archaeon]